jgi:hypothetical protein
VVGPSQLVLMKKKQEGRKERRQENKGKWKEKQ